LYFNPELEFTFHERQEQEYYFQRARARGLGLAGHPPPHPGKNKFSVGGCPVVLKIAYIIESSCTLSILEKLGLWGGRIGDRDVGWNLQLTRLPYLYMFWVVGHFSRAHEIPTGGIRIWYAGGKL